MQPMKSIKKTTQSRENVSDSVSQAVGLSEESVLLAPQTAKHALEECVLSAEQAMSSHWMEHVKLTVSTQFLDANRAQTQLSAISVIKVMSLTEIKNALQNVKRMNLLTRVKMLSTVSSAMKSVRPVTHSLASVRLASLSSLEQADLVCLSTSTDNVSRWLVQTIARNVIGTDTQNRWSALLAITTQPMDNSELILREYVCLQIVEEAR